MFVLVTGPPAGGKTTLSMMLAEELGLPRLAKDTIKHGLLQVLDAPDLAASHRIGSAAVRALLAVAAENRAAVLDSVWVSPESVTLLQALPGSIVEVFCQCDLDELRRRYHARAEQRRGGQYDFDLERPESERWNGMTLRPLAGGWPVVTVDPANATDRVPTAATASTTIPTTFQHPAAAASARALTIVDEKHCRHQVQRHVAWSSAAPALAIMFDRASDRKGSLHSRGSSEPIPGGMRLMSGRDRGEVLCVGVVQRQPHECPVRLAVRGEPRPVPATEVAARAAKPSLCHVADDPAHSG